MKKGMIAACSALTGIAAGAVAGIGTFGRKTMAEVQRQKGFADKHLALYLMMNQWVKVKQENKSIAAYLEQRGYKEVAIYGMNYVGETLLRELTGTEVKVKYAIDKNADQRYAEVDVVSPEQILSDVDAVIVTAITFFDEIEEELSRKVTCPILSLEDILYEV